MSVRLVLYGRARALAPVVVVLTALCVPGLFGCSVQNDWRRGPDTQAEKAALASDTPTASGTPGESQTMDYDPWESLNERTFSFNFKVLDRYALKPAAKLWSLALPEEVRQGLANAFDNLAMPKRFVNKILQRKAAGSG